MMQRHDIAHRAEANALGACSGRGGIEVRRRHPALARPEVTFRRRSRNRSRDRRSSISRQSGDSGRPATCRSCPQTWAKCANFIFLPHRFYWGPFIRALLFAADHSQVANAMALPVARLAAIARYTVVEQLHAKLRSRRDAGGHVIQFFTLRSVPDWNSKFGSANSAAAVIRRRRFDDAMVEFLVDDEVAQPAWRRRWRHACCCPTTRWRGRSSGRIHSNALPSAGWAENRY